MINLEIDNIYIAHWGNQISLLTAGGHWLTGSGCPKTEGNNILALQQPSNREVPVCSGSTS